DGAQVSDRTVLLDRALQVHETRHLLPLHPRRPDQATIPHLAGGSSRSLISNRLICSIVSCAFTPMSPRAKSPANAPPTPGLMARLSCDRDNCGGGESICGGGSCSGGGSGGGGSGGVN